MARYGRLQLSNHPGPRPGPAGHRPVGPGGGAAQQEGRRRCWAPASTRARSRPSQRARAPEAGAREARLARRGRRRVRRRRAPPDRARRGELAAPAVPDRGRRGLLARRLRCRRPALRVGQDDRRRPRDGTRPGHHPDPRHQHRRRPAVARRAAAPHHPHRRRDRRVLRRPQGDPPRHDRHLPGDDDQAAGHLPAPGGVRLARLGPDHLRRGAPAARADLPLHRGHPVASSPRADRDARARGRPRERRVLPHRPEALRRALEGHREPGLHRARRLHRGARHAARRRPHDLRHGRAGGPLPAVRLRPGEDPDHRGDRQAAPATTGFSSSGSTSTSWPSSASTSTRR